MDVLTQALQETCGLAPERVIGTGTTLDTSRLRETIGRSLGLSCRSIHAHVVGAHGDSEVVLDGRALRLPMGASGVGAAWLVWRVAGPRKRAGARGRRAETSR